jgi:hypothetical protein
MTKIALLACLPFLAAAAPLQNSTCIRDPDIAQTQRPDDNTILFLMRDHKVWKNTLPTRCFGLQHEPDGFTYQPTDPGTEELCSGQVTIRLNTFKTTCLLGNFTRMK